MSKTTYSLLESFEMTGRWWLPGKSAKVVPGTLRYSPEELVLVLNGCFDEPPSVAFGAVPHDLGRFSQIHGVLANGHHCTLANVFVTKRQHNLRETTCLECSAFYLLIGCHVSDIDTLTLTSLTFGCTHLDSFLNATVFDVEQNRTEGAFEGLTVKYSVPPKVVVRVAAIRANLDIQIPVSWSEDRTRIVLTAEPSITITPDHSRDVEWYITKIWRFVYLLTLVTSEPVVPIWLRFAAEEEDAKGWILYKAFRPDWPGDATSALLLFNMAHLHEQLSSICDKWFSASDVLADSIHLYMDAVRDQDTSLQGRFLTLSQALEAFSRATTVSEYMPKADYEKVVSDVVAAIPNNVDSDHRASLKSRIKYGNEHSLRKRLTFLVESLTPDASACVCTSPRNFVAGIVDTRNYLTHYTDELRPNALRGPALHWACEKMVMLLRILFLRHTGVDEQSIVTRLANHSRLMQYIHLRHKYPECVAEQRTSDPAHMVNNGDE